MTKRRANSEGTLHQRKDGLWQGRLSLPDGKRKSFYGKTQREVMDKMKEARKRIDANLPPAPERLTVAAFLEEWLEQQVKPNVSARTHFDYASIARWHLFPEVGHIKLVRLSARDVQGLLNRKREAGLSPRRVQYIHAVLRAALSHAKRLGLVSENVAKLVQVKNGRKAEAQPFTPDEARQFLQYAHETREEAIYVLALTLGLRQGELLGLTWDAVDMERGILSVRLTAQYFDRQRREGSPKTERSTRKLVLPSIAQDALRAWAARQAEERLRLGSAWRGDGHVFTNEEGKPLTASQLYKRYVKLLRHAGLRYVNFHGLRHAAASFWLASGMSLREVQELLGHSTIVLTANLYTHLLPVTHQNAADKMDALLSTAIQR